MLGMRRIHGLHANGPKKTSTERVRAFRERQRALNPPKNPPKSSQQRMREYRARRKALKSGIAALASSLAAGQWPPLENYDINPLSTNVLLPNAEPILLAEATQWPFIENLEIKDEPSSFNNATPSAEPMLSMEAAQWSSIENFESNPELSTTYDGFTSAESISTATNEFHEKPPFNKRRSRKDSDFYCTICFMGFVRSHHYKVHMQLHSDERPYECEICHKTFKLKSHLTVHKSMHSEKQFQCEKCPSKFSRKQHLIQHLVVHSDERPFECPHCPVRFKTRALLHRHVKTQHLMKKSTQAVNFKQTYNATPS